jgi:hypothetical protein
MSATIYRALAGAFTAFCVVTQYWLTVYDGAMGPTMTSSVKFLSFFTILTNALAAVALLAPVAAPRSALGMFLARPSVRTAITGYMIIVGAVYFLLLRNLSHREGFSFVMEMMLHYVTVPLFLIDWLAFVPKRGIPWRVGIDALAYPLVYVAWTLVHGAVTGWYPYPFLDVAQLGYGRALVNIAALVAVFLALMAALVGFARGMQRRLEA